MYGRYAVSIKRVKELSSQCDCTRTLILKIVNLYLSIQKLTSPLTNIKCPPNAYGSMIDLPNKPWVKPATSPNECQVKDKKLIVC